MPVGRARHGLLVQSFAGVPVYSVGENPRRTAGAVHLDFSEGYSLLLSESVTGGRGTHFEDALAFCRKAGYRPELAWTCCDYADALLQRNNPGDREKAMSLLDESLAISSELGMRPLMERVLYRLDILKA